MAKNKARVVTILESVAKLLAAGRLQLEYTECAAGFAAAILKTAPCLGSLLAVSARLPAGLLADG